MARNKSLEFMKRMGLIELEKEVEKVLESREQGLIVEMALPRKVVKQKIEDIFPQIIQNWCLIHYAQISGEKQTLVNHWKNELMTHLSNVIAYQIKDNDSYDSRKKIVNKIIIDYDYTNYSVIDIKIWVKFKKENIDIKSKNYAKTLFDFVNALNDITHLICLKDRDEIDNYVSNM